MTTQMLLNSKCLDKLVLQMDLSVIGFALSLFACNVPSELKRVSDSEMHTTCDGPGVSCKHIARFHSTFAPGGTQFTVHFALARH